MGKSAGGSNGRQSRISDAEDVRRLIAAGTRLVPYNRETGFFAKPGLNSGIRNFHCERPHAVAERFAEQLARGWERERVEHGWKATNGKLTITYRDTSRTETNFPVVDIRWNRRVSPIAGIKSQRVHFLRGASQ